MLFEKAVIQALSTLPPKCWQRVDGLMCESPVLNGFQPGARPICVFCNAPWSDAMIRVYDVDAQHGEGSYDFGPEDERAAVEIKCENCKRLIYKKEFRAGVASRLE